MSFIDFFRQECYKVDFKYVVSLSKQHLFIYLSQKLSRIHKELQLAVKPAGLLNVTGGKKDSLNRSEASFKVEVFLHIVQCTSDAMN